MRQSDKEESRIIKMGVPEVTEQTQNLNYSLAKDSDLQRVLQHQGPCQETFLVRTYVLDGPF